ncbi:MAG: V-type ATP synthase subunit E [Candidatus Hydrogenedentes bacterium]|nr:V-type ATP synthase subunit E [Candidatus Hydrogenedentota bacterium]
MGLQDLCNTLEGQVAAQCEAILEEARREAASILEEAGRAAVERRERALEQERAALAQRAEEGRRGAEAEAAIAALTMRQAVAEDLLERAGAELERIALGPEFGPILARLLDEALGAALDAAPDGDLVVEAPGAYVDRCRARLGEGGVSRATVCAGDGLVDGVRAQDAGRTFRVTNTLSARFEKVRTEARRACVARLTDGGA